MTDWESKFNELLARQTEQKNKPSKTWIFTRNNYSQKEVNMLKETWAKDVTRMRVSHELGENGTPHLQGRITFKVAKRFSALKKLWGEAHWEAAKSDCFLYEAKMTSMLLIDVDVRAPGRRTDLESIKKKIEEGTSKYELWKEHFGTMVKCHNGIYEGMIQLKPRTTDANFELSDFSFNPITNWSTSQILWGKAGIGKTEFAKAHFPNGCLMVSHIEDLREFNPKVHEGIIFDDMSFTHLPRTSQIHLLDIDNHRSIHCRYSNAVIPAHTKKIFTTTENER